MLVVSNHQSHLDPPLVGVACPRRLNCLARETLFHFAPFRWLINSLDAIPIDREGLGLAGIKESLRRLKRGEMVTIFPEGTRTGDGEIGPFLPGFTALAVRGKAAILPVAIEGAFVAWPRGGSRPLGNHSRVLWAAAAAGRRCGHGRAGTAGRGGTAGAAVSRGIAAASDVSARPRQCVSGRGLVHFSAKRRVLRAIRWPKP